MNRPRIPLPPPLAEAQVAEAEQQLGVVFPEEYREYLLTVSAGGQVHELKQTEQGWWWDGDNQYRRPDLLRVPFPHPDSYVEIDNEQWAAMPNQDDFGDDDDYRNALRAWDEDCGDFEDRKTAGAIIACDNGCGFSTLLVITGPLAGTVWWDGRATCDLIVPLSLDHARGARPLTFGEWIGRSSADFLGPGWGRRS